MMRRETDWERVRREAAADAPIARDAEAELYDPSQLLRDAVWQGRL
ncbi:MAG: hypothetical protein Q8M09_12450 [Pseudomonadota bacterium]|nr:hypothetical protein [Pseudomonadota bacterium]MDP1905037.1 hypothetical protein [Pseudomonadota bacterium]